MKEVYIITGITGYVGNVLVKNLLAQNKVVRGFARSEKKVKQVFDLDNPNLEIVYGDTRNIDDLKKLFDIEGEIYVIHTAAIVSIQSKKIDLDMYQVNVEGTKNIVNLCLEHKVKRLVYVSSVHALEEQKGLIKEPNGYDENKVIGGYAKTKAMASRIVLEASVNEGLDAVILHPSGIIGPYDYSNTHMSQVIKDYLNHKLPASVKGGYNFVDVRDVVFAIEQVLKLKKHRINYLITGAYYHVGDLLKEVASIKGLKKLINLPMFLAYIAIPFLWIYTRIAKKRPLYTSYALHTLKSNGNFSYEKAKEDFNYCPRSLHESIKDELEFFDSNKK